MLMSPLPPFDVSAPVICREVVWPAMLMVLPNGMMEIETSASTTDKNGARIKRDLCTCGGVRSSFRMNLMPSASGCKSPNGPTRVGPHRFCMRPTTLRSSHTV